MTFYENMAAVALALISDKGQSLPIRRISKAFDPVTSTTSAATKVSGELTTVVVPLTDSDNKLVESLGLVRNKVRKVIAAASDAPYEPAELDVLDLESGYFIIRSVTPVSPAGTPLVYHIIAEKGSLSAVDLAATEA